MDADYSVELGPTAAALEIPWRDPDGRLQYLDLRADPAATERLPEVRSFPALGRFLADVNSLRSPWQTAKCDVWAEPEEPAENPYGAAFAHGCYVDLVLAVEAAAMRESLDAHQRAAKAIAGSLEGNEELVATAEIVVRRCYFHPGGEAEEIWNAPDAASDAGYCLTLFLTGYGSTAAEAAARWEQALGLSARCLLAWQFQEDHAKARELR